MTELVALLVVWVFLLVLFVLALLKTEKEEAVTAQDMARLAQVVPLAGLSFRSPEVLFRDHDHRWLHSNRALREVARLHRRDRREMVLMWLRHLQSDLFVLWRVRRLLAGFGAETGVREELLVFQRAAAALLFLLFLRVFVWVTGPFFAIAFLRGCRAQIEMVLRSCTILLARVPPAKWPEIEKSFVAQFH